MYQLDVQSLPKEYKNSYDFAVCDAARKKWSVKKIRNFTCKFFKSKSLINQRWGCGLLCLLFSSLKPMKIHFTFVKWIFIGFSDDLSTILFSTIMKTKPGLSFVVLYQWHSWKFCQNSDVLDRGTDTEVAICGFLPSLQWPHNGRDGVSNYKPHNCLLNRLFKAQIKENVKAPCHWPLCGPVNSPHKGPVIRKISPFDDVIMIMLQRQRG